MASIFKKLSDSIDSMVSKLVVFIMLSMVVITTMQVVFRIFFDSLTFSEELSRYLLVWGTFFASTMAYKRGSHVSLNFLVDMLKGRKKEIVIILNYILSIVFFAVVAYYGYQMVKLQVFQTSPAMGVPMKYIYLSIPISLVIMVIHAIDGVINALSEGRKN